MGKTRGAILALLFGRPDEKFYLRQVVRASGYGLGPVQRELNLLTGAGIIRRTQGGRQVYFQSNPESPVFPELKSLIAKMVGVGEVSFSDARADILQKSLDTDLRFDTITAVRERVMSQAKINRFSFAAGLWWAVPTAR